MLTRFFCFWSRHEDSNPVLRFSYAFIRLLFLVKTWSRHEDSNPVLRFSYAFIRLLFLVKTWSRHEDSNPGPSLYKSVALPTELCRRLLIYLLFKSNYLTSILHFTKTAMPATTYLFTFQIKLLDQHIAFYQNSYAGDYIYLLSKLTLLYPFFLLYLMLNLLYLMLVFGYGFDKWRCGYIAILIYFGYFFTW